VSTGKWITGALVWYSNNWNHPCVRHSPYTSIHKPQTLHTLEGTNILQPRQHINCTSHFKCKFCLWWACVFSALFIKTTNERGHYLQFLPLIQTWLDCKRTV